MFPEIKNPEEYTLFLDRDGVINHKLPGEYVTKPEEFRFLPGVMESIPKLQKYFGRIIVITNQQGVGKEIMTIDQLSLVHKHMIQQVLAASGFIDAIYFCPDLDGTGSKNRKPETGMAHEAKKDFPEIDFSKTVMVGDSISDMLFGKKLGITTVYVGSSETAANNKESIDYVFQSLKSFTDFIYEKNS
jgi:histidinol-phosphate phosphatase family protein